MGSLQGAQNAPSAHVPRAVAASVIGSRFTHVLMHTPW
jgi:hypothetical protein